MKIISLGVKIYPEHVDELRMLGEFIEYKNKPSSIEVALNQINDAEIIISSLTKISKEIIYRCTNLKMISLATTGYDDVDMDAVKSKNIIVTNIPNYATESVAEHAIGLMISAARLYLHSNLDLKNGLYDSEKYVGKQLKGKILGIVGYGRIGKRVAQIAELGFEMRVIAYDINMPESSFHRLLSSSDFISLHVPLTNETKNMISYSQFDLMKKEVVIVNTSRGAVIDEQALVKNLESGKVFSAGLDVLSLEPANLNNPFINMPNVIITSHIGFNTNEALYERSRLVTENIKSFISGSIKNLVRV